MKNIALVFLCTLCLSQTAFSDEYQFMQFRVEDGLKSDIIKTIAEDSLGFIWIGSDDGLIQHVGNEFIHYPKATESPFIKDLIRLRNGKLLALNDLGLVEIINEVDTVIFKKILSGSRDLVDTSLWYPKSFYEDSRGNLWISEPHSVVKYDGNSIKRIEFEDKHFSTSFVRSFAIVELGRDKMLISSHNGSLFIFDNVTNKLRPLNSRPLANEINHMIYWNNQVYIASTDGLFSILFGEDDSYNIEKLSDTSAISYLLPIDEETLLISTFTSSVYFYNSEKGLSEMAQAFTVINQAFKSRDGNIWLATEKGIVLLSPKIFQKVHTEVKNIFLESIVIDEAGEEVYFSSKEHIRKYDKKKQQVSIIDHSKNGYFLTMKWMDGHLWASNGSTISRYNRKGELVRTWDFTSEGNFIFDIEYDKNKTLWITQQSAVGLKSIDHEGRVTFFKENRGFSGELAVVRTGEKGVYAGSNDPDRYLLFKTFTDTIFKNISVPFHFNSSLEFSINDMSINDKDGTIWLATSLGLLRYSLTEINKIEFGNQFDGLVVKSVVSEPDSPFIWFSNAFGLIQYNTLTEEYIIIDESLGLPSNTIYSGGLILEEDAIWVGTANGLAYSKQNFNEIQRTPTPFIVQFSSERVIIKSSDLEHMVLPPKANIGIVVASPTYPSKNIRYQYKIDNDGMPWTDMPFDNVVLLSKVSSGKYSISFRAKKPGYYNWSMSGTYEFTIEKGFYETWYFICLIIVIIFLLVISTRYLSVRLMIKRQEELEKLVSERTLELERVNANLVDRNQELDQFVYSTSHDLSAPLKSIRGLINISRYENDIDSQRALMNRIYESVVKLEAFIRDVISYSRNARLRVKKIDIPLKKLVLEILDNFANLDNFQKIKFDIRIDEDLIISSDETRLKIVLNNLLSNAVKFQRFDEEVMPLVHVGYWSEGNHHFIKVSDNGHGIPKELLDKIFNMFYRANVDSDGSGLGLYILKETLKKLQGDVQVKSKEGVGSEFVISFPEIP